MDKSFRVTLCGAALAAGFAMVFPAHAQVASRSDAHLGTQLAYAPSASAGSSAVSTSNVPRGVKTATVYYGNGPDHMNVKWGDTVLFTVRRPGAPDHQIEWRFDGLDSAVNFAAIDPQAQFADNVIVYVTH